MTEWAQVILGIFKLLADARVRTAFFIGVTVTLLGAGAVGAWGAQRVIVMHDAIVKTQTDQQAKIQALSDHQVQDGASLTVIQGGLTDLKDSVNRIETAVDRIMLDGLGMTPVQAKKIRPTGQKENQNGDREKTS